MIQQKLLFERCEIELSGSFFQRRRVVTTPFADPADRTSQ